MASTTAHNIIHPNTALTHTDRTIPRGTLRAAPAVSSATAAWDAVMRATASNSAPAFGTASGANAARANRTVPTLIAASTATRPARLNHAVAHPHPRPPRVAAQWYSPPAVGNADAIWPMV